MPTVSKDGTSYTVDQNWIPYDRMEDLGGNIIAGLRVPAGGVLYWKGDDGNLGGTGSEKQGSIHFRIWIEAQTVSSQIDVWELNDGGAAGNRIRIYIDTNNQITVEVVASGGTLRTATVAGDVADEYIHDIHVIWRDGLLQIYRDGVPGTAITAIVAADIPDELDRIQQCAGGPVVEDPEIWKIPYFSGVIAI